MKKMSFFTGVYSRVVCLAICGGVFALPANAAIKIRSDFPGANVAVLNNDEAGVTFAPDLRGDRPWFYWYFEAQADGPSTVEFTVSGDWNGPRLTINGPATSLDGGKTWQWLGAEHCRFVNRPSEPDATFTYQFTKTNLTVRFAVGIPYVQANLDAFISLHQKNPDLRRGVLAQTLGGRSVTLLRIGEPAPNRQAVLMAARSHASEALASYVLEGFLDAALSDTVAGKAFREHYVLYAAPLLDTDGVEKGDQGKNRLPHDHNRDYGRENIYPEIKALQTLADETGVVLAVDFHCPLIRGDIHETFYWAGRNTPHIRRNFEELTRWMDEEIPLVTQSPKNFGIKPEPKTPDLDNLPFSNYFSQRPGAWLGVTLESPYSQRHNMLDASLARAYGAGMLRAWVRTEFLPQEALETDGSLRFAALDSLRAAFQKVYMGKPDEAVLLVADYLKPPNAPALFRCEANVLMGKMRLRQRQFEETLLHARAVLDCPEATVQQQAEAVIQQLTASCNIPDLAPEKVQKACEHFEAFPYLDNVRRYAGDGTLSLYYERASDPERALFYARRQLSYGRPHEVGVTYSGIVSLLSSMGRQKEADHVREKAIAFLRKKLFPVLTQGGILYGVMAGVHFELLRDFDGASEAQRLEAANIVTGYPTVPVKYRESVETWRKTNEIK